MPMSGKAFNSIRLGSAPHNSPICPLPFAGKAVRLKPEGRPVMAPGTFKDSWDFTSATRWSKAAVNSEGSAEPLVAAGSAEPCCQRFQSVQLCSNGLAV
eukprot:Skav206365  [mRNA]  locus=scaffold3448:381868:386337:+ [translate_table: standard]